MGPSELGAIRRKRGGAVGMKLLGDEVSNCAVLDAAGVESGGEAEARVRGGEEAAPIEGEGLG